MKKLSREIIAKWLYENKDYKIMVAHDKYPEPGRYVITGIQMGNMRGEQGYIKYIGYVVQVRLKAGAFGSDMVLIRHPDGRLVPHENQSYYYMSTEHEELAKLLFDKGITPEKYEDYSIAYTLTGSTYPAIGKVITENTGYVPHNTPLAKITVTKEDGSKQIIIT